MISSDREFNSASNMTDAKITRVWWVSLHSKYHWKFSNFTGIFGKSLAFSKMTLFQNDLSRIQNLILHRTWRTVKLLEFDGSVYTANTSENFPISLVFLEKVLLIPKWPPLKMISSDREFHSASNMTDAKITRVWWVSLHSKYQWKFSNFTGIFGKSLAFSKMTLFQNDLVGYRI